MRDDVRVGHGVAVLGQVGLLPRQGTQESKHKHTQSKSDTCTCTCDIKRQDGGAIWNGGEIKFLKNSDVKFDGNVAQTQTNGRGGHIFNLGALVFRSEAVFESGLSGGQGGALYFRPEFNFEPPRGVGMK